MQKRGKTEKRIFAALAALILTGCPFAAQADVTGNESNGVVVIEDGAVITPSDAVLSGSIYGLYYDDGTNAEKGSVTIRGSVPITIGDVYGGYSAYGDAIENTVNIEGGSVIYFTGGSNEENNLIGGSSAATAAVNRVTINGATISSEKNIYIRGAFQRDAGDATFIGNSVEIFGLSKISTSGTIGVYGTYVRGEEAKTTSTENSVTISGGEISASDAVVITGASSYSTEENSVNISGGTISGSTFSIYGGRSAIFDNSGRLVDTATGTANGNEVIISGGTIESTSGTGTISGGYSYANEASSNSVDISGGKFESNDDIDIYGGYGTDTISKNEVEISGGEFSAAENIQIWGGYTSSGAVTGNTVTIDNSTPLDFSTTFSAASVNISGGQTDSGSATDNKVNIDDGTFTSTSGGISILGGYGTDTISKNEVNLSDGTFTSTSGDISIFGSYGMGTLSENEVKISGGEFSADDNIQVLGGSGTDLISKNEVEISGGVFSAGSNIQVLGGYTFSSDIIGAVTGNTVNLSNGKFSANSGYVAISGGAAVYGSSTDNKVNIDGGDFSGNSYLGIGGGYVYSSVSNSSIYGNEVNIYSGDFAGNSYLGIGGGIVFNANDGSSLTGNTVNISGGEFSGSTYLGIGGGYVYNVVSGDISLIDNTVNIDGGTFTSTSGDISIFGSYGTGTLSQNEVNISDGEFSAGSNIQVLGGYTPSGAVTGNTVSLSGGEFSAHSGYVAISGGAAVYGSSTDNKVNIDGGDFSGNSYFGIGGGYVYSSDSDSRISGNEVNIYSGDFTDNSYLGIGGGIVFNANDGSNLTGNTVNIYGGDFTGSTYLGIGGGYVYNVISGDISLSNNTVNIYGGTFTSDSGDIDIYGGYTPSGDVTGNTVNLSGGAFSSTSGSVSIYAGYSGSGSVTNNTINITGEADVTNASLYGSNAAGGEGNTLVVDGWAGGDAAGVYNFNEIWFQNMEWETDATVLTITDNTVEGALSDTSIYLGNISIANAADLSVGDTMTFLSGEGGETLGIQEDKVDVTGEFTAGVALAGTGEVLVDENAVAYTITGLYLNTQTDLITEVGAAGASFVANAGDLISDALDVLGRDELFGTKVFGIVQGVKSKYDVSERMEITGWNVIAGVGNESARNNGVFSWAAFYEGGTGNFHTWNRFENELFHSRGGITYNGGGLAAKYEADNGFYTEASVRAGELQTDMRSGLMDASGTTYGYDTSSSYWGAHIGIGKILSISETRDLDIYGKFYHTEIDGDGFAVADDWFDLHDITSNRLRVGARVIADLKEDMKGYYGLAWEYEFSGDAEVSAYNLSSKSSFGGSTGVAEAGITWRPNNDSRWLVDLNARGYIGEREGGSLSMMVSYAF